jgi:hypothetical protein
MKRVKLFALTSAVLLLSVQAYAAPGPFGGDKARDGTMVCADDAQKVESSVTKVEHDKHAADNTTSK